MPFDGYLTASLPFLKANPYHVWAGYQHQAAETMCAIGHAQIQFLRAAAQNPFLTPFVSPLFRQMLQGNLDFAKHVLAPHPKHEFDFTLLDRKNPQTINGHPIGVDFEIVDEKPYGRLKRVVLNDEQGQPLETPRPPMLLIAPMSGHFDILLTGTVHELMTDYDLYITDWTDVKDVPLSAGQFTLDHYISYLKDDWLPLINIRHHREGLSEARMEPLVHTLAVCQPGVPLMAAASLMAEDNNPHRPLSITMMGSPIDTRINPTKVNKFAEDHPMSWFENHAVIQLPPGYPGSGQLVYPGAAQLCGFMAMNFENHAQSHQDMMLGMTFGPWNEAMEAANFKHLTIGDQSDAEMKRAFYEDYKTVMDTAAAYYLQTIKTVFQEHHLPQGVMVYTDPNTGEKKHINPASITDIALLTVEGEKDDITGKGQTRAAHDLTPNLPAHLKHHYEQPGVGHYGIFNGRRWRKHIAPRIVAHTASADERAGRYSPLRHERIMDLRREKLWAGYHDEAIAQTYEAA